MKTTFKSTAKVIKGGFFATGEHKVMISSIIPDVPSKAPGMPWTDLHQQLKVTFKNEEGVQSKWYQLAGYKSAVDFADGVAPEGHEFVSSEAGIARDKPENYLINSETGERVESVEKTAKCMQIIGELANDAGLAEGEEFGIEDLLGREIGIVIKDNEIAYTKSASRVKGLVETEA